MADKKLISGFTFIKNGLSLAYPFKESIESMEPICDEIIINVGFDDPKLERDDGTYQYLRQHFQHPKFKFLQSYWDPELCTAGRILAQQTNLALSKCQGEFAFYLQGDEVLHEDDLGLVHNAAIDLKDCPKADGVLFNYLHFYGNTNIIKHTRNIYRREIRLIRNHRQIKSWKDAQGFRYQGDKKVVCLPGQARIFHYGWSRKEQLMDKKVRDFGKLYHGPKHQEKSDFTYERIWGLHHFKGSHPRVMDQWIKNNQNDLDIMALKLRFEWKNLGLAFTDGIEKLTGYRLGEYKNYILTHPNKC